MAEPARNLYDSESEEEPQSHLRSLENNQQRPDLRVINGGQKDEEAGLEAANQPSSPTEPTKGNKPDDDTVGKGFNPDDKPKPRRSRVVILTRRRTIFGGGLVGIILGGFLGISTIIGSGPFQFIQLGQLLSQFHFASLQDSSDDRVVKIFRFINDARTGQIERTRMGIVGNKIADNIEAAMNASGIESAYTDKFGNFDGYVIDPSNDHFKGMTTPDEIKQYFKDTYDITLTEGAANDSKLAGMLVADGQSLGFFKSRAMVQSMLEEAGYSKLGSTLGARIMGKRASISWHPLSNLDSKVQNALEKWWKNFNSDVEDGASSDISTTTAANKNETAAEAADQGTSQGTADGLVKQAGTVTSPTDTGGWSALQGSIGLKIGLGGAALIGVACLAYGIIQNASELKQAEVVMPLIRMGMEAIIVGSQVMRGQDVNMQELSKLSGSLDNSQNQSWTDATSIQAEQGEPLTGVDANSTIKSVGAQPPFSFLTQGVGGGILSTVCSAPVQILVTIVSFLGGPISAAVGFVASVLTGPIVSGFIKDLAGWLIGNPINPTSLTGPQYGNAVNYGSRLAADQQAIAAGGTALTTPQVAQLNTTETLAAQQQFSSQSLAYKLFNPDDPKTVASKVIDSFRPTLAGNFASLTSSFLNIGDAITSTFGDLFTTIVHAAPQAPYDYGFPEFGFSQTDLNNPLVENPFQNASDAVTILDNNGQNNEPDYISLAQQCFAVTISQTPDPDANGHLTWDISGGSTTPTLSSISQQDCVRPGDNDWLRIRFFIFDTENTEAIGCYENDAESCNDIDMNNGTSSTSYAPNLDPTNIVASLQAPTKTTQPSSPEQHEPDQPQAVATNRLAINTLIQKVRWASNTVTA